jgi:hypothetical protein
MMKKKKQIDMNHSAQEGIGHGHKKPARQGERRNRKWKGTRKQRAQEVSVTDVSRSKVTTTISFLEFTTATGISELHYHNVDMIYFFNRVTTSCHEGVIVAQPGLVRTECCCLQ